MLPLMCSGVLADQVTVMEDMVLSGIATFIGGGATWNVQIKNINDYHSVSEYLAIVNSLFDFEEKVSQGKGSS